MNDYPVVPNSGDLQPYSPSQPLAPSADSWGELTPREIDHYQQQSGSMQLFGQPLPPGTTQQQVEQRLGEISRVFLSDFTSLGHPPQHIQAAISWFKKTSTQPIKHEINRTTYELHDQLNEPLAISFANAMQRVGASQSFVSNCLWWIGEVSKRFAYQTHAMDGDQTSDGFTDEEWNHLHALNDTAKVNTTVFLKERWGQSYYQNMRMVDAFLQSLPAVEQQHFDQILNTGIHALNDPTVILGLYDMAIGSANFPSGGALQSEIESIEKLMQTDRVSYLKDGRLQARLRRLYELRDG